MQKRELCKAFKEKTPKFVQTFKKYLEDSTQLELKLYQLLQGFINNFKKKIHDLSKASLNPAAICEYKEYHKNFYLRNNKPVAQDNFEGTNIYRYISLSVITTEQCGDNLEKAQEE